MKNIFNNKLALATSETKEHSKLVKSKKGWLKVSMGTLTVGLALFTFSVTSNADVTPNANNQPQTEQVAQAPQQTQDHVYDVPNYQNVRTNPSLSADITGQLYSGQSIHYDYNQEADGYNWLHYVNYNGQDRWTADLNNNVAQVNNTPTQNQPETTPQPQQNVNNNAGNSTSSTNDSGSYTLPWQQNVRNDSSLNAGITGQLDAGYTIHYNGTRESDGYNWLHYVNFGGQDRWLADMNGTTASQKQATPAPTNENQPTQSEQTTQTTNTNNDFINTNGSYTVSDYQNVRNGASLNAGITGQLYSGQSISYDGVRAADGYNWLHYKNFGGQDRWIADMNGTYVPLPSNELPKAPTNLNAEEQAEYMIKVASQFLGEPYVWGGANPSQGFDCSGLTSYALSQVNVQTPRRSQEQYQSAKHINADEAKRGDLVFFSKTYDDGTNWNDQSMTHVGIYLGNGQMLDSQTGGVKIEDVTNFSQHFPTFYGRYLNF